MEKRNTILDRGTKSSEYITGKQDFDTVLKAHKAMKPPLWKSAWFYGPVGLAVVAVTLSVSNFKTVNQLDDNNATLIQPSAVEKTTTTPTYLAESPSYPVVNEASEKEELSTEKEAIQPVVSKIVSNEEIRKPFQELLSKDEVEPETLEEIKEPEKKTIIEEKKEAPRTVKNKMPRIAGVFTGRITLEQLADEKGLVSETCEITSYVIQYHNGIEDVSERIVGNKISKTLHMKLKRFNLNSFVFITQIRGIDENGIVQVLPSMNITPTF